jgi:pyruvate kinase
VQICATIGRNSHPPEIVRAIVEAGAKILRFNFGNGFSAEKIVERIAAARAICRDMAAERQPLILCDIPYPRQKLRLGSFDVSRPVTAGEVVELRAARDSPDAAQFLPVNALRLPFTEPGEEVAVGDGEVLLRIAAIAGDGMSGRAEVLNEGVIRSNRGLAMPGADAMISDFALPPTPLIELIATVAPDYVAYSFIEHGPEFAALQAQWGVGGRGMPRLMAKVESPTARERLGEIFDAFDAVMFARGDLGVQDDYTLLGLAQWQALGEARRTGKPVFIATQVLESFVTRLIPNRAEICDLTTLALNGASGIVLARETSNGPFPAQSVASAARIIRAALASPLVTRRQ